MQYRADTDSDADCDADDDGDVEDEDDSDEESGETDSDDDADGDAEDDTMKQHSASVQACAAQRIAAASPRRPSYKTAASHAATVTPPAATLSLQKGRSWQQSLAVHVMPAHAVAAGSAYWSPPHESVKAMAHVATQQSPTVQPFTSPHCSVEKPILSV